jgi:uncharacterized protein YfdQ (DUF2303 family)
MGNFDLQDRGEHENLAATLSRLLPKAEPLLTHVPSGGGEVAHFAVPKGFEHLVIDNEGQLPNPRRSKAVATLSDAASFIDYVKRHASARSVVWCNFNPVSSALDFTAVIDEHDKDQPGWRVHQAKFKPAMSVEWGVWNANNKQAKSQVDFAEFIESNEADIASFEGMPTSLQMHTMATEFVARQDMLLKSTVRLQGGGVNLTYIADVDKGTTEAMKVFERFAIGIPVFWAGSAFRIDARLKYRLGQGKVTFFYELIRPDRVHEAAAKELIAKVREAIGETPLLMGSST